MDDIGPLVIVVTIAVCLAALVTAALIGMDWFEAKVWEWYDEGSGGKER